ncbi:acyl-ACP thioesterase [Desulfoluna limicola]|uniref:Acyl-ACP thioesterase n=1 Tax=Desulfoluna limicola TaxID=2810562 RepID=A0ABN6FA06_9BACT|nr:acyl-ACP thioesterase domain-containing protein [Desulfoluna limicola]BCS97355.1 acyl-ACP thioesterase [Desulfoluna limicola]
MSPSAPDARFSFDHHVEINDVGPHGDARLSALLNWFQTTSSRHSASLGYPVSDLTKEGLTWIITRYHLCIDRSPRWRDALTVETWRAGNTGTFTPREFLLKDSRGETLVRASASYTLLDIRKRKAQAPSTRFPDYPVDPERAVPDDFSPLPLPEAFTNEKSVTIRRSDMDFNGHANNALYTEWCMEGVSDQLYEQFRPIEMEIAFKGEVFYGEDIVVQTWRETRESGPVTLHCLLSQSRKREVARARVHWKKRGEQRSANGETRG